MGLSFLEGEQDDILGRDFRILAPWRRQRRWSSLGRSGNTAGIRWARPDPRRARTQARPTSLPGNAGSGGRAEAEGEALALVREGRTQALGSGGRGWEWWPCVAQPRGRDCVTARRAPVCVRPDANACESLRILATVPRHFRGEEREPQVWGSRPKVTWLLVATETAVEPRPAEPLALVAVSKPRSWQRIPFRARRWAS